MPRPDPRAPGEGQESMFPDDSVFNVNTKAQAHRGRISTEVEAAFTAARAADLVTDVDRALMAVVRHGAWAMDNFEASNKPYGAAKLTQPVVEALRELGLTPASRADATDEDLRELLQQIATPTTGVSGPDDEPANASAQVIDGSETDRT